MRLTVALLPVLLTAASAQAAPLRVAVLSEALPGLDPALVAHLGQAIGGAGHTVTPLNADQLADPGVLGRGQVDVLVLPHSPSFPGRASANVEAFLQAGGNLVLLGGYAYSRPLARVRGAWTERAGFETALRGIPNALTWFGFEELNPAAWQRSSNHPEHLSALRAGAGPQGACLRLELKQLGQWQWDTYAANVPQPIPAEHDLFCLQARGGERTPQAVLEIDEADGSRWVTVIDLTPTWQRYVLESGIFRLLKDGSPAHRGGAGDRLRLAAAARFSVGLASGLTKHPDGDHLIEIDEVGTAANDLGVALADYRAPNRVCFDDYEPYALCEVIRAVACTGQDIVPATAVFQGPLTGLSAVGFTLWDRSRLLPLLVAQDRHGRDRGWACAALLHYAGSYAGGSWLLSGVTTPAFYRSDGFTQCLTGFLAALAGRDLPKESAALNQRLQASALPLVTPPPEGLRKSPDGKHFETASGTPFFLIGADYIGSLDRKFFGGPWLHWIEADFRRAHAAGLNSLRLYGASALWRDPEKLAALKECARTYGIYLLLVVVDHTDLATRTELAERGTQVAQAFRDEPMLLGYDLQNEPYAYKLAEVKDGGQSLGERYPLWKRWGEYEAWAGLQTQDNFTSFPGVRGPLPRDAEWGPVLAATSDLFGDWISWQTEAIRAVDPTHPITVGFNSVFACVPGVAGLDFVSHHAYQPPTDYEGVLRNLTTLDRLRLVWPDRPITLGEFGYTNGLALPDGWLDLHSSAMGEFLHYLYAYAHGFAGCMKWVLTDHPLELSRQQCTWMPADDLPAHIDQGRYGMYWSDGTDVARPKPLVWALRFFRDWLDAGGGSGELAVTPAPTRIGSGYVFRAERARFVGNLRHAEPGLAFEAGQAANVLLRWDARQAVLVSTADATLRLDPARLCGWPAGTEVSIAGMSGAVRHEGQELVLEMLEGESLTLTAGGPAAPRPPPPAAAPAPESGSGGRLGVAPGLTAVIPASVRAGVPRLEVDLAAVVTPAYYGGAVQWDAHEWFDLDPVRWQRLLRRVEFMRPGFIRCMLLTYWYCTGYRDGRPLYVWDSVGQDGQPLRDAAGQPVDRHGVAIAENLRRLRKLYDILDVCQAQQIDVLCGEWGAPAMGGWTYGPAEHLKALNLPAEDPRYAEIVGGFIRHLLVERGYTCVKEFNLGNEANLASAYDATWTQARWQTSIRNLHRELTRLGLAERIRIVGPDAGYWNDLWFNETLTELADEVRTYDLHWYLLDRQVRRRTVEHESRLLRNFAALRHPERAIIYGEMGLCDDLEGDQQWHVRDYDYGVGMAAAQVQAMRAGFSAVVAWSLDDSIHLNGALPPDYRYKLTPTTVTKVWGMWNSLGTDAGRPADEALRPWYTTWSLLSRCFPKGSSILRTSGGHGTGLCAVAARIPAADGRWHLSLALVNVDAKPASCALVMAGAPSLPTLSRYVYSEAERPADAEGFPVPVERLADVDLAAGLTVTVPARAAFFYTTLEGGTPVVLPSAAPTHLVDTLDGLEQVHAHSGNLGFNGYAVHPNRKTQQDLLPSAAAFLGNRQRVHRAADGEPAFLTWRLAGVSSCRLGLFHRGVATERVRVLVSPDNAAWRELPCRAEYTEATTAAWSFSLLRAAAEGTGGNLFLRVEILPVGAFDEAQLTYVELATGALPELQVTAVEPVRLRQTVGHAPELPDTVLVYLNQALPRRLPVQWDRPEGDGGRAGEVVLEGHVAGSAAVATATVEMVSTLTDPMDSMDYVLRTSANIGIDVANAAAVGDKARFMRTTADPGEIVYGFVGLGGFELAIALYSPEDIRSYVAIQVATDGVTWQPVDLAVEGVAGRDPAWHRYRLTNARPLPAGSSYLRIQLSGNPCTWLQQVGEITLRTTTP